MICAIGFMFYSKGSLLEAKKQTVTEKGAQAPQQTAPCTVPQPGNSDVKKDLPPKSAVAAAQPANPAPLPKSGNAVSSAAAPVTQEKSKASDAPSIKSKAEPAQTGHAVYCVQVGAFKNKKSALAVAKRYDRKGYETSVHKTSQGDKKIIYRVLIGKFSNRSEAADWAKKVAAEEKIKTAVFKR